MERLASRDSAKPSICLVYPCLPQTRTIIVAARTGRIAWLGRPSAKPIRTRRRFLLCRIYWGETCLSFGHLERRLPVSKQLQGRNPHPSGSGAPAKGGTFVNNTQEHLFSRCRWLLHQRERVNYTSDGLRMYHRERKRVGCVMVRAPDCCRYYSCPSRSDHLSPFRVT